MLAMLIAGRLIGKVDLRLMLLVGFAITAFSLWQMAHYSLDLSQGDIVWPGVIQGIGMGLVFVPLSAATFATLSPEMRGAGHRPLQPGAQHRQQHRHLAGADLVGAQHRHRACLADRARHPRQSGLEQSRRRAKPMM